MSEQYLGDLLRKPMAERLVCGYEPILLDAMTELWLLIQDRLVEEGDCLIWTGANDSNGSPRIWMENKCAPLRRVIWTALRGTPRPGLRLGVSCGVAGCVAPAHLKHRPPEQDLRGTKRTIAFKARIAATKRAGSDLSEADVAFIRSSSATVQEMAAQFKRSQQTIYRIRKHVFWKAYVTPFAGLGARV